MIKVFALDMDGTLLNKDHKLSKESIEAIRRLNQAGVKTVLTSGRVMSSLEATNEKLAINNPMIANNGAFIKLNDSKVLSKHPLKDQSLNELIDFCQKHKFIFHFYDEDTFYSNSLDFDRLRHLSLDNDYGLNYQCNISISKDPLKLLKEKGKDAFKILIGNLASHPLGFEKASELIHESFDDKLYVTSSGYGALEIMEDKVDKWQGIKELIKYLAIDESEVASIGDSYNDLPMIKNAKIGFAMANANEKIKEIADYVVASNDSNGIKEASEIILAYNKENPSV